MWFEVYTLICYAAILSRVYITFTPPILEITFDWRIKLELLNFFLFDELFLFCHNFLFKMILMSYFFFLFYSYIIFNDLLTKVWECKYIHYLKVNKVGLYFSKKFTF